MIPQIFAVCIIKATLANISSCQNLFNANKIYQSLKQTAISGFTFVTDHQIDAATPQMLKDACYIMLLVAKTGYNTLTQVYAKTTKQLLSKPARYTEYMKQYDNVFYPKDPRALDALMKQLSIQKLEAEGMSSVISDKIHLNILESLQKKFGDDIWIQKVKSSNIQLICGGNIELHSFQVTLKNGQKFLHDIKVKPSDAKFGQFDIKDKSGVILQQLKQKQQFMKYLQQQHHETAPQNTQDTTKIYSDSQNTPPKSQLAACFSRIKIQVGMGVAFRAIFNCKKLYDGKCVEFGVELAKAGGTGVATGAIQYGSAKVIAQKFGQQAGDTYAVNSTRLTPNLDYFFH